MAGIYEFLRAWGHQKLESMRGCPIKNYVMLMSRLSGWQTQVSSVRTEVISKGGLLLLSCHEVRGEMESQLESIRKDILEQVQSECRSRSQQLIAELTDFVKAFQSINSDIHAIAWCSQKLNEANQRHAELEEQMGYTRSLSELVHNHFGLLNAENEALDISLLDAWESFQFEKSQASEFLLSKRHAIVPKLQQLMVAVLAELEDLIDTALSSPFMDPAQEQRSTERQLISLERQFQSTASYLGELHHAYTTFTGTGMGPSAETRAGTEGPPQVALSKSRESHTFILVFYLFIYLGRHPQRMEVPRLGVKSELQLPAYTTATAMPGP
uniref:Uncharacterized protein n=1 Tax=Catagonus wagneri TaxID=51154 RepID=A0A8C3W577_9CETA